MKTKLVVVGMFFLSCLARAGQEIQIDFKFGNVQLVPAYQTRVFPVQVAPQKYQEGTLTYSICQPVTTYGLVKAYDVPIGKETVIFNTSLKEYVRVNLELKNKHLSGTFEFATIDEVLGEGSFEIPVGNSLPKKLNLPPIRIGGAGEGLPERTGAACASTQNQPFVQIGEEYP